MICEPVLAGLAPHKLESGTWELRPPNHKGAPAIAGYRGITVIEILSCREFPEARPAYWEAPETLQPKWVCTSGETEVRGMWVFSPGETPRMRRKWVFSRARL